MRGLQRYAALWACQGRLASQDFHIGKNITEAKHWAMQDAIKVTSE